MRIFHEPESWYDIPRKTMRTMRSQQVVLIYPEWCSRLVGGIPTPLKTMSSSIGMMIPISGKIIQSCSSYQPANLVPPFIGDSPDGKSHKIPFNHHFPMVFLWFFNQKHRWASDRDDLLVPPNGWSEIMCNSTLIMLYLRVMPFVYVCITWS